MSSFPHLPLFTDAFIADTGHLSAQETGAYLMLLMMAWRLPDCRLPNDDNKLAPWARVDRRTWLRIKPKVMEYWTLADGFWSQKRLSKERDVVSKRAEVARKNGEQGGRPKSLKNNEAENPAGSSWVTQQKAPIPIPIPTEHSEVSPLRVRTAKRAKAKTRIEQDTQPDERHLADARERQVGGDELRTEWRRFRDYHLKEASTFADWHAAWRNWLDSPIRARERRQAHSLPNGRAPSAQESFLTQSRNADREMRGEDDASPFLFDAEPVADAAGYTNGHARPALLEPPGGNRGFPPPRYPGPARPH
ncbi:DUF1376 domain-containing protein [Methylobacterium fujisawaense]|uniref:DUF1376 domain-containing protein n=1 Tax=Methylobacterium fujisawaense TaxID=107400 RepID=UPI00313CF565